MAVNFCLPPVFVDKFKQGLRSGEINPQKLADMDSVTRRNFLAKYVGEDAAPAVNAEFESKLLLKNQIKGMTTWAKGVAGVSGQTRRDLLTRIEKMDRVLDPADKKAFLADLAEKKLGVGVSVDEAKTIAMMSNTISKLKEKRLPDGRWANETDMMDYGRAVWDLGDYLGGLKNYEEAVKLADFGKRPVGSAGKIIVETGGVAKALTASLDLGGFLRQGLKTLINNPNIWRKNVLNTLNATARELGGKNMMRELQARIYADPMYDLAQRGRLAVGNIEEAFPTRIHEKLPGIGRVYRASDVAYTGFVQQARFDLFKEYVKRLEQKGININDTKELRAIAEVANSQLGRGKLPFGFEKNADVFNKLFFAPRFVKSLFDTFTLPMTAQTQLARRIAAENTLKEVGAIASLIVAINAYRPGSVELDPRSSDFGKIKIGDTRFDITGGNAGIMTLVSRIIPTLDKGEWGYYSKSTSTGSVRELGEAPTGPQNALDVAGRWIQTKASPFTAIVLDALRGEDFLGNQITVEGQLKKLYLPLIARNLEETANNPNSPNLILTTIADGLGISANTYSPKGAGGVPSWSKSESKDIQAFRAAVGEEDFTSAAKLFDNAYNAWLAGVRNNPGWKDMSNEKKTKLQTAQSNLLKKDIFNRYNFKYEKVKSEPIDKNLLKGL